MKKLIYLLLLLISYQITHAQYTGEYEIVYEGSLKIHNKKNQDAFQLFSSHEVDTYHHLTTISIPRIQQQHPGIISFRIREVIKSPLIRNSRVNNIGITINSSSMHKMNVSSKSIWYNKDFSITEIDDLIIGKKKQYDIYCKYITLSPATYQIVRGEAIKIGENTLTGSLDGIKNTEFSFSIPIIISATKGFLKENYDWQYTFDNSRQWKDLPSNLMMGDRLVLNGEQLLGDAFEGNQGKSIHFRIAGAKKIGDFLFHKPSNILTYSIRREAPLMAFDPEPISPSCHGNQDAGFKLTFQRPMKIGEEFYIAIREKDADLAFANLPVITSLDVNNSFTYIAEPNSPDGIKLKAGNYEIKAYSSLEDNPTVNNIKNTLKIHDPIPITFSLSQQDIRCFEANDGQIQLDARGGTGNYSVSINGAEYISFNQDDRHILTNQAPGQYNIRIQDSNGCIPKLAQGQEDQRQITLTQPSKALAIEYQAVRDPLAYGYRDGEIQVVLIGGTKNASGGYSYRWRDSQGNQLNNHTAEIINSGDGYRISLQGIPAGQYSLEVWDSNTNQPNNQANCYLASSYTLNQPAQLLASIALTKALDCHAAQDGILQVTATGGVTTASQGYQYQWEQQRNGAFQALAGANSPILQDLGAGNYRVQVTDNNGIQVTTGVYTLTEPGALVPIMHSTNSSCYQADDASIQFSMSGGTGPYEIGLWIPENLAYHWSSFNQGTSHSFTRLAPGLYRIKLRDSKGCIPQDASGAEIAYDIQISQPDQLRIVKDNVFHPSAFGYTNGELQVWIAGGTLNPAASYTYTWEDAAGTILNTHNANLIDGNYHITLSDLPAGMYSLSLQDAKGCTLTQSYQLDQPEAIVLDVHLRQEVSCFAGNDGKLEAVASGGITIPGIGYHYQWFRLEGANSIPIDRKEAIADGLTAGIYSVRITDANNISLQSNTITITEPTALQTSLLGYTPINCFGAADGTISIHATGATAPYQIGIQGPGEHSIRWLPFQEANNHQFTGLAPGQYQIQVRDAQSCQERSNGQYKTYTILLDEPAAPLAITAAVLTEPLAYGQENGSIEVRIVGGRPNADGQYQYTWKDADGQVLQTHSGSSTTEGYRIRLATIPAGTYSLSITDYAGQSCSTTRTFLLEQPDPLLVSLAQITQLACHGDNNASIQATVTGGVRPANGYTYQWYKTTATQPIRLDEQGPNLLNLATGSYYLEVIDANAIQVTSSLLTVTEPDALVVQLSKTDIHCYAGLDGTILSSLTGGTAPYQIGIRLPGAGSFDWKAFSAGDKHVEAGLYSGTYEIRFRDANGCTVVDEQGIEQIFSLTLTQPDAALTLVSSLMTQPLGHGLSNGKIEVIISGGTAFADGSYQYRWEDSQGNPLGSHFAEVIQGQYHIRLDHIPAGSYKLLVTDKNHNLTDIYNNAGCYVQHNFQLEQPDPIVISLSQSAFISCFGTADAQLDAEVKGGVLSAAQQDYLYSWYRIQDGQRQALVLYTSTLAEATAGDYQLQVQDANGILQHSEIFRIQQPDLLQVQATDIEIACGDSQNGRILSTVTGGTAPYRYEWSNGATSPHLENAGVGKYLLIVTDANGCSASTQALVSSPSGIEIEFKLQQPSCHGASDGSISLQTKGGALPLHFEWADGRQEKDLSGLKAGSYKLRISDANGCTLQQEFTLTDPAQLIADAGPDVSICRDQRYTATAKSSQSNVHYLWVGPDNFKSEQASIEVWQPGTYSLTLTNSRGCVATDQFTLKTVDTPIDAEFVTATQVFAGLSSTLVNISETEADRIEWVIPKDKDKVEIKVINESAGRIELQFTSPGTYTIGMRAFIGDCSKLFNKQVTVLPSSEMENIAEDKLLLIDNFVAYPNPNSGQFTAKVSLAEVSDIRLRLINLSTGRPLNDQRHSGQKLYELAYQLSLPADLYVLILEVKNEYRTFKIIVK